MSRLLLFQISRASENIGHKVKPVNILKSPLVCIWPLSHILFSSCSLPHPECRKENASIVGINILSIVPRTLTLEQKTAYKSCLTYKDNYFFHWCPAFYYFWCSPVLMVWSSKLLYGTRAQDFPHLINEVVRHIQEFREFFIPELKNLRSDFTSSFPRYVILCIDSFQKIKIQL